ncbi:MAG TPA: DNA topoisomerase III [Clostridiaceae bacterium]
MGKILVLAEKPSVGRELARVLGCRNSGTGYISGDKYVVTWALGHLVTLADPEAYGEVYKKWSLEALPMLPDKMELVVIKETSKQFGIVKNLMRDTNIDEMVIATDAGREGELVARWIIEKANFRKPIKRLWISSQTDKAIKEGFSKLKNGREYENLYRSALCRAEADWIVGLNITRALTCKFNAQLSAGRVQSATLAMIVNREEEIRNFVPKDYYVLKAHTRDINLSWKDSSGNSSIFNEEKARSLLEKLKGKDGKVKSISESYKKQSPPLLYDLTELQRDGNKLYGYGAKETLSIMQRLYENYKLLTYPRTDSRYISADIVATLPERLRAISTGSVRSFAEEILRTRIMANKNFVDDSKVTDHHAIIPTEERGNIALLSSAERNIYNLVVKRFLAVLMPPYEYLQTSITVDIGGESFYAKGNVNKAKGWKRIYEKENFDEEEDVQTLPDLKEGDTISGLNVELNKLATKPPLRFNEGTLLSAMEKPQNYITFDKIYAKTLGETGGIGTVATRADIIEKLFNMFYIEKNGKEMLPTSKGKQLISLVPEELKSPLMTAKWELQLDLIKNGQKNPKEFIDEMKCYATSLVKAVKGSSAIYKHDNQTGKKCPNCGKYLLEVKGKFGVMNVCQDRACGHRENVSRFTNARCPNCHKKLEIKGEGEGQLYTCGTCSFHEKLSTFNKRFDDEGGKANKRDVSNLMNKINRESEAPLNSALAEALAKLNLK